MTKKAIIITYSFVLIFSICIILLLTFLWPANWSLIARTLIAYVFGYIIGHSLVMIPYIAMAY